MELYRPAVYFSLELTNYFLRSSYDGEAGIVCSNVCPCACVDSRQIWKTTYRISS